MNIQLRLSTPADYARMAELNNAVEPEPISGEQFREMAQRQIEGRIFRWMVATDESGHIVGFNRSAHSPWMKPGHFWVSLIVDAALRRQGIGSALYDNAVEFAVDHGATHLETEVRDHLPDSIAFAEHRGFRIDRHGFESKLDVSKFDESRFAGTLEAVGATGIRFFTLADLDNAVEAQRKLYDLVTRTAVDDPGWDGAFPPFEVFQQTFFGASGYRADGQIVAAEGDHWIGYSAIEYQPVDNSMLSRGTAVDRAYRGRKIAQALKLLGIRCARQYGATWMRTMNDAVNAPMLAINRKLGYQPEPGAYRMVKTMA